MALSESINARKGIKTGNSSLSHSNRYKASESINARKGIKTYMNKKD